MCQPTHHAIKRAGERWLVRGNTERIIREFYENSQVVGSWEENEKTIELRIAEDLTHAMVVDTVNDTVVTVYVRKPTPLANAIREDVLQVHDKSIKRFDRQIARSQVKYRKVMKQYGQELGDIDNEIARLQAQLDELYDRKAVIEEAISEPLREIDALNSQKKTVVKSKMHYMA